MYFFIGAKNKKMYFLAQFLKELGHVVACDKKDIIKENEAIFTLHPIENAKRVIKADDITKDNTTLQKAFALKLKVYSYQEVINYLVEKHQTVMVLDSNSIFLSLVLTEVLNELRGCNCLIEEYCARAKRDNPYIVLKTNIEDLDEKVAVFYYAIIASQKQNLYKYIMSQQQKLNKTKKIILVYGDYTLCDVNKLQKPVFFYGLNKRNDISVKNLEKSKIGFTFDLYVEETFYGHFDLAVKDKRQLVDIMAVIAICYYERFLAK